MSDLNELIFGDDVPHDLVDTLCAQFGLTRKRLFFAEHYCRVLNATKAATLAGFGAPSPTGSMLLGETNVQAYIAHRFRQLTMQSREVLGRLSDIARGDIGDYLRVSKEKKTDMPLVIDGKIVDGIYIDLQKCIEDGNTARIKKYSRVRGEVTIELHDPTKALELIGKHYRLFADVQAVDDRPIKRADDMSDDELARIAADALAREAPPAPAHGPIDAAGVVTGGGPHGGALGGAGDVVSDAAIDASAIDPRVFERKALARMIEALEIEIESLPPMGEAMNIAQRTLRTYKHRLAYLTPKPESGDHV